MLSPVELNSVWDIKKKIAREHRRLIDLAVLAESTTTILDGMPHSKPVDFKVERIATMSADCSALIDALKEQLINVKFALLAKIQACNLPELQERVLSYHYVSCLKFREIGKRLNYTNAYIHKIHLKALSALGLTLDDMHKAQSAAG